MQRLMKKRADMHEKDVTRCMNSEAIDAAGLNEDKSMNTEQGVKMVGESLRSLSFARG
jgi:hypothetical protein